MQLAYEGMSHGDQLADQLQSSAMDVHARSYGSWLALCMQLLLEGSESDDCVAGQTLQLAHNLKQQA